MVPNSDANLSCKFEESLLKGDQVFKSVARIRIPSLRSPGLLRLDRNERVADFSWSLADFETHEASPRLLEQYPDPSWIYAHLRESENVPANSDLIITSGLDEAIRSVLLRFTLGRRAIASPFPTYQMYDIYPEVLRLNNYRIDFTSSGELNMSTLRANLRRGIDVLFLVNPGQPIESHLDLQEISELASEARRFGSLVFVDEAYYGFGSETAISLLADNDNLLIGRSFSKTFGAPGIRLGFIVAQRHITNRLLSLRLAHEMNSLSLLVAQHLLLNKSTIEEYNREIMKTRDYLLERLTSIGIPAFGSMANYLRLDLKNYKREFITHLSERNIRVKDGFPSPWDSSVTATVGPLREMEPLLEAVSSFANQT